jgi:hypothetical protein
MGAEQASIPISSNNDKGEKNNLAAHYLKMKLSEPSKNFF